MKQKKKISICVPCYNEEDNVIPAYNVLKKIVDKNNDYDYELIFVDNGSKDKTREMIKMISKKDKKVKGIFLSRNFGPEASGHAALDRSTGDIITSVPADLQEPPELINKFIKKWEEGYDIVLGVYSKTEDNLIMGLIRRAFYLVAKKITTIDFPLNVSGFGLFDKRVLLALRSLPEKHRFGRGLLAWVGFKRAYVVYQRRKRLRGKSSYNFFDYLKHAERGIFGFSYVPLDLITYTGFILVILSFIFIFGYLILVFIYGNPIQASIPIMLASVFFGGIQLLAISIIGKYIQVIVEETKSRPMYIIDKIINDNKTSV